MKTYVVEKQNQFDGEWYEVYRPDAATEWPCHDANEWARKEWLRSGGVYRVMALKRTLDTFYPAITDAPDHDPEPQQIQSNGRREFL